jgi:hypothetical protein
MLSVPITTKVVSSNPAQGEVYICNIPMYTDSEGIVLVMIMW